jgi:hypothetical protein
MEFFHEERKEFDLLRNVLVTYFSPEHSEILSFPLPGCLTAFSHPAILETALRSKDTPHGNLVSAMDPAF